MMKKDKSVLGRLDDDIKDRIFTLGEKENLEQALAVVNAPKAEGGYGIAIKKSAFAEWLERERARRSAVSLAIRLRRGGERLDQAAALIKQSDPAAYDEANMTALRELVLDMNATGHVDAKDVVRLYSVIQAHGKLAIDREKLAVARREVAVKERKFCEQLLAAGEEVQAILRDRSLGQAEQVARLQLRLFGEKPADVPTLAQVGGKVS